MERILITGASGRLARHLIPLLLERKFRVRALVHQTVSSAAWASQIESVRGDFENVAALNEALADVDIVCHLAALMPPSPDDEIFRTNIRGTYNLLQAIVRAPRKPRFVFASTDATYCTGWSLTPYHSPIDENTALHPAVFYGVSKVLGEQMCTHFQEIHGIPTVRLRFDWILEPSETLDIFVSASYKDLLVAQDYGKWDDPHAVKIPLEEQGSPFVEHICDVRDSAHGALLAVEKDEALGQVFNIAGPAPFAYTEIGPILASQLGVDAIKGRCKGLYSYEISNAKARSLLGYSPHYSVMDSLEEALSLRTEAAPCR